MEISDVITIGSGVVVFRIGGGSFDDGWTDPVEDAATRMSRLLRGSSSPDDD